MKYIYVCRFKLLGFAFAYLDKEKAENWVDVDPESRCFDEVPIYD